MAIKPYSTFAFGDRRLSRIDSDVIEEFACNLLERGLSARKANRALLTLKTILQHTFKRK